MVFFLYWEMQECLSNQWYRCFPCLYDHNPVQRRTICLKVLVVMLHLLFGGLIWLVDPNLIEKTKRDPWYTALYLLLFVVTSAQFFFTAGSSPGYVLEAMRAMDHERDSLFRAVSESDTSKLPVSGRKDTDPTSWTKLVMELYPPGSSARQWTCDYCNLVQPPRSKHCLDCCKCVLEFDHHCVWLGTCVGQGNHCRFWWYLAVETTLCIWTGILYIEFLKANISKCWWLDVSVILLLTILAMSLAFVLSLLIFHTYLLLTNQTTYEVLRRSRVPYLKEATTIRHPFSRGIWRNLYDFCCAQSRKYRLEAVPASLELEAKSRPSTCCSEVLRDMSNLLLSRGLEFPPSKF
ncbi:hypothetical protein Dimus_017027 [Dionaea muscipula]